MNKKCPLYISSFLVLLLSLCACKKDKPIEKRLIGTWELNKITFLETNQSFLLDSFRNVFNVSLTLNSDFSFSEMENIGGATTGVAPLGSNIILTEHYNSPRNTKARYLILNHTPKTWPTSHNFSIKQDSLVFKVAAQTPNSIREEMYARKFNLKGNNELDIERLDLIVFNKESSVSLTHKLKFSYRRK